MSAKPLFLIRHDSITSAAVQQCTSHCKALLTTTDLQQQKFARPQTWRPGVIGAMVSDPFPFTLKQMALAKLKGMREAGRGIMQRLSDSVLADLLWKLSSNNQPADLLRTLKTMQRDDKYLAQGPHNQHDQQGRSFLTAWLAAKPRASVQGFQGRCSHPHVYSALALYACMCLQLCLSPILCISKVLWKGCTKGR